MDVECEGEESGRREGRRKHIIIRKIFLKEVDDRKLHGRHFEGKVGLAP